MDFIVDELSNQSSSDDNGNKLATQVKFNKKIFYNKELLSYEMATYWDLSLSKIDEKL